jgi:hypothetical protein
MSVLSDGKANRLHLKNELEKNGFYPKKKEKPLDQIHRRLTEGQI